MRPNGTWKNCFICEKPIYVTPCQIRHGEGRYCSRTCKHKAQRGKFKPLLERPSYIDNRGYVMVPVGPKKYKPEHRIVMEKILNRPLMTCEHVHHINRDRADNRPENLQVLMEKEHIKLHAKTWFHTQSRRITLICKRCGEKYERKNSRIKESNYCSNKCKLEVMHEGNRKS
ncbi:MAG: HNH endonuclease [Thermodesulfobacteriota bacterium]